MAGRLLTLASGRSIIRLMPFGSAGGHDNVRCVIGNRDIVGYGLNGEPEYADRPDFPFPSIRWQETTPDLVALHEKEKGDWRKLSLDEKKCLYRASFCQTFSEFNHGTGQWKSIIGSALFFTSFGIWAFILIKLFVYDPLPESFSLESQRAQLRRMLDMRVNVCNGISSKWNFETDTWKK